MALVKPPIPVGYCKATAYGLFGPTFWNNVFYFAVNPTTSTAPADILADIGLNVINFYRAMSFGRFTSAWQVSGRRSCGAMQATQSAAQRWQTRIPGQAAQGPRTLRSPT